MFDAVAVALNDRPHGVECKFDRWLVRFITGDAHIGTLTDRGNGVYQMTSIEGDILYFDAAKVLYVRSAE
jgi:hypothetical protein